MAWTHPSVTEAFEPRLLAPADAGAVAGEPLYRAPLLDRCEHPPLVNLARRPQAALATADLEVERARFLAGRVVGTHGARSIAAARGHEKPSVVGGCRGR